MPEDTPSTQVSRPFIHHPSITQSSRTPRPRATHVLGRVVGGVRGETATRALCEWTVFPIRRVTLDHVIPARNAPLVAVRGRCGKSPGTR